MRKISIVQVNTIPLTFWAFARGQLQYLKKAGFDVTAICGPGPLAYEFSRQEGVPVILVPMTRRIAPARDLWAFIKLVKTLKKLHPHLVQGSTPKAAFLSLLAARLCKVPVCVFLMRGLRFIGLTGWKRLLVKHLEKISCLFADRVLVTSPATLELALSHKVCSKHKLKLVNNGTSNGIDVCRFSPFRFSKEEKQRTLTAMKIPAEARVLLFVGRLVKEKGLVELAQAWKELRSQYHDVHLLLVGPFEPHDALPPPTLAILNNDPRIHMTGFVKDPAIMYAISDILVFPSYREGIGYAPLEAGAMGLPTIASNIPGCNFSVLEGKTGLLFPCGDVEALKGAIAMYLDNRDLAREHGELARQRVLRDFAPEAVWSFYVNEYRQLLVEKGIKLRED